MARPQVEFIQSQQLTWRAGALGGARKAWEGKVLSRDADTGATSAVVRIPPGFSVRAALGHDEEILVLSGRISVNGVVLGPYAYMHMPAGAEVALESPDGAIAVHFLDGPADAATPAAYDPARIEEQNLDALIRDRRSGGLGLRLIRSIMDDVQYQIVPGEKNELRMMKRLKKHTA